MSNPEHISSIIERHPLLTQRSKLDKMSPLTIPRTISLTVTTGDQAHHFATDVTGLHGEDIQDATDQMLDAMLLQLGLIDTARADLEEAP